MKILYLITKSEAGGAQTYVYQLAKYFNKNNKVAIMSDKDGWLQEQADELGVEFYKNKYFSNSINPINIIKAMLRIRRVVKEYKPDLIHCNSSMASLLGRLVVRNKVPTIFTAHGWGFNIGTPFLQKSLAILGEKLVSRYCSKIICVSNFVKDLAIKNKIANKDKFTVIYNGVKNKEISNSLKDGKIKLIFIGRLADPKRPMLLLKTINNLSDDVKNKFEVNIIGDGEKRKELEEYIAKNNLVHVKLWGQLPREQVINVLSQSHVLVFLSKWEGFPYVILEAMSLGVPVISSDVGGIKEVVDNDCGFLLSNDDRLGVELEKLVNDNNIMIEKGKKAKDKISNHFSVEQMLNNVEKEYNEATGTLINKKK